MHNSDDHRAWAQLDLQRFKTVADAQCQALAAHDRHCQMQMELLEKAVKIEKDKTELEILQDKFARFKSERHALLGRRARAEQRAKDVERHKRWLRKLSEGEYLPQSQATFAWSAFYFFMDDLREPDLTVPSDARAACHYVHEPPINDDIPAHVVSPWGLVLFCRRYNLRPRCGSPAMRFLQQIVEAMVSEAEQQQLGLQEVLTSTQAKIDAIIERGV